MNEEQELSIFWGEHKRMPTYEEMKSIFGVASKNTVSYRINRLIESGFLLKEGGKLMLAQSGSIIRLGTVQAGFPTAAEEDVATELLSLDEFLIDKKATTYMLEVVGESMKDAGILPGDLVLVERGKIARRGDIVLASIDHEYTLKYLESERGKPVLVPANKKFKKIYPGVGGMKIEAVLKAVIRKYR